MAWKHGHGGYNNHKCRCEICKAAVNAYNRSIQAEYRVRPAQKAYNRAYQAKYRLEKRAEKLAYGVEYKRRRKAELNALERSPEGRRSRRIRSGARRARKLRQFIEDVDPIVVYRAHGGCCGICKGYVPEDDFHVDHVISLARGGMHGYINCQPAHPKCNLSKGAR